MTAVRRPGRAKRKAGRRVALRIGAGLALLILAGGIAPSQRPANAQVGPDVVEGASAFVQQLAQHAIAILQRRDLNLERREAAFRALLKDGFDLPFIGRFVLGKYWRRAKEDERADYLALFSEYVLKTYSRRLGGYSGEQFTVEDARAAGKKDVIVQTRITRPSGPPILADWRVRVLDGRFRIIDVSVEGVSMALSQRSEFSSVVSQHGMHGLLQALRARTERFAVKSS